MFEKVFLLQYINLSWQASKGNLKLFLNLHTTAQNQTPSQLQVFSSPLWMRSRLSKSHATAPSDPDDDDDDITTQSSVIPALAVAATVLVISISLNPEHVAARLVFFFQPFKSI